jgi:hypothetical protein
MLVLDQAHQPVDRVATFWPYRVERTGMLTVVRLLGKLVAYVPHERRSFYQWAVVASYRRGQHLSVHQIAPPHLRMVLFSRWEFGLILGHWLLGLKLGQPLAWVKRFQTSG